MKYKVTAERTFTIDYTIEVEADSEASARVKVEQMHDELPDWEDTEDCTVKRGHEFNERKPNVFEIEEV